MEENLRKYLESLFADAPKTKKTVELREELYLNLKEKYQDLVQKGATEDEAFEIVKRSVGDVDRLIQEINEPDQISKVAMEQRRKKSAMRIAIAVGLYILSPVAIILFGSMGQAIAGLVLMFALIAAATSIMVYNNITRPKFVKIEDTMVEEFREWKASNAAKAEKKNLYSSIVWPIIVVVYFLVSFTTGAWYVTWVIFILGAVVQKLIEAIMSK
jgi:uncharacterized membrane protein